MKNNTRIAEDIYRAIQQFHPAYLTDQNRIDDIFFSLDFQDFSSDIDLLSRFTSQIGDGHTNIEIPFLSSSKCVNVMCKWCKNRIYITAPSVYNLQKGDIVVQIEGRDVIDYYNYLSSRIPHENNYLVNSRSCNYPYENYNLFSDMNLTSFLHKKVNALTLTVIRNGKEQLIYEPITYYNGKLKFVSEEMQNNFYFVSDQLGVLQLYSCACDRENTDLLRDFFMAVKKRNIRKIVLDLSRNMGGNSDIITEFLRYLNIEKYNGYHVLARDGEKLTCLQNRKHYIYNHQYTWSGFKGELFCNIGNDTFSSGRMFATLLKDNQIATLCGEPSGGRPSSYGAPQRFVLKGSNIRYRVSTRFFLRPDSTKDAESFLTPELVVPDSDMTALIKEL